MLGKVGKKITTDGKLMIGKRVKNCVMERRDRVTDAMECNPSCHWGAGLLDGVVQGFNDFAQCRPIHFSDKYITVWFEGDGEL